MLLQMPIHGLRSSSIEATYTFEFLGEHVQLTKHPAVEKVTDQEPVSGKTRKAICETFIRLFWIAGLFRCFQDNKKQNNCEV